MAELITEMEWLWHIDLDMPKHLTEDEIAKSARLGWRWLKERQDMKPGDKLVMVVVRPHGSSH